MSMNRRELFKFGGGMVAGLALVGSGQGAAMAAGKVNKKTFSLSGNENPYGPSPAVLKVLNEKVPMSNRYGYSMQKDFVKEIARKEGVQTEQIIFGSGSTEVIGATILSYTANGGEVITADLSYAQVRDYTPSVGGKVILVPVDAGLKYDLEAIHDRVSAKTNLVYICNPNNPSGTLLDPAKLRDFCTSLPKSTIVMIDEAYLEFTDNFQHNSMVDLVKKDHNVVVTRTFSKIHGLAGLRIGYGIAPLNIAKRIVRSRMCKFQGPLGVSAARVSMNDQAFQDFCRARVKEGREVVYKVLDELKLDYVKGAGNFVFFDPKMPNATFKSRMLAKGIGAARPFPPKPDWARLTIGTTEEMQVFAKVLPEVIRA